ncbi:hypothetical protein C8Q75DRAFT_806462 [Abortiporus biennis]|nr:hypothetical protein C8Q75DRAFT_806462 [Abortiporus biennis]
MPLNTLTRDAGIKIGPLLLETLLKHYFDRVLKDEDVDPKDSTRLRRDELLYDEAFNIVKAFLEASTKHTVEELQRFSNTRTPSPPWVHVVKLCVPMTCCDDAATYLIQALGGEEMTKRVVGGTKWWQVRGVKGVDAEWIVAKKDWAEAKKKAKAHKKTPTSSSRPSVERSQSLPHIDSEGSDGNGETSSEHYQPEMDEMRCILYAHGGGYYFGSVDQERYSIQRHARKINGRVFAVNYRLAPQYPFPCAIQDLLAAYLFLIRPPEGASHQPVKPAHIVVSGDSAGGGLCIALLQVLRDTGLPLPAGGVLVSPWCDLTHSFPSIHINTATDVIPQYGLSLYKPSTLWPPPPDEITHKVQESVRSRIRHAVRLSRKRSSSSSGNPNVIQQQIANSQEQSSPAVPPHDLHLPETNETLHLGSTASLPLPNSHLQHSQPVACKTADGQVLTIEDQIQLYAPNTLLAHPLISPVVGYLGGLPPLFVIASDKEVLRDEVIYFAHKAAHPDKYPIKDEARKLYPALEGIEERFGPTKVHLQVYDDTAHVLPVLFSFTTPAKYCYRAIATFVKYVTGMPLPSPIPPFPSHIQTTNGTLPTSFSMPIPMTESPTSTPPHTPSKLPHTRSAPTLSSRSTSSTPFVSAGSFENNGSNGSLRNNLLRKGLTEEMIPGRGKDEQQRDLSELSTRRISLRRAVSSTVSRAGGVFTGNGSGLGFFSTTTTSTFREEVNVDNLDGETRAEESNNGRHGRETVTEKDGDGAQTKRRFSLQIRKKSKSRERRRAGSGSRVGSRNTSKERSGAVDGSAESGNGNGSRDDSTDVAGPRFHEHDKTMMMRETKDNVIKAGQPIVYEHGLDTMIRERVSTHGVIRPLEPESELSAFAITPELLGVVSELAIRRYLDGRVKFDKKFRKTTKSIAKYRHRNLELAKKDAVKHMTQLQTYLEQESHYFSAGGGTTGTARQRTNGDGHFAGVKDGSLSSGSWSWAWALDADEHPPPSSIVSRRDTTEALELARIADQSVLVEENFISGNNLWSMIVNFLTVVPDKKHHGHHHHHLDHDKRQEQEKAESPREEVRMPSKRERFRSKFAQFVAEHRKVNFHLQGEKHDNTASKKSKES